MYKPVYPNRQDEIIHTAKYYNTKSGDCPNFLYYEDIDKDAIDLYITAFNNIFCIEYQIKTLRMFMKQKYNIIIVDNNNNLNPDVSKKTYELCVKEGVTYIKAPDNYFQTVSFDPSMKLGSSMNWIYQNCVKKRQTKYFGYLDQDCFLISDCDMTEYLDSKNMYGQVCIGTKSKVAWNLHVIANFYRYDVVKDLQLDFRASHHLQLDTGGSNYEILFKDYKSDDYQLPGSGHRFFDYDIGDPQKTFQYYSILDGKWLHMGNSAYPALGQVDTKVAYIKGFLDGLLIKSQKFF